MSATLSPLFTWRTALCHSSLPANTRHVGMVLSLHMSELGSSCFPGIRLIAEECGRSPSTVTKAIGELEEKGWLEVKRGGGRGKPNRYTAVVPVYWDRNVTEVVTFSSEETLQNDPVNVTAVVTEDVLLRGRKEQDLRPIAATPRTRADRDQIWDALTDVFGPPLTRTAESLRGRIVSSLLQAGATAAQIRGSREAYRERMPAGTTFTETALEKHWTLLQLPVEAVKGSTPNMKYGRRDVTAAEMLAIADRLEAEERRALAAG